ncbi:MAG: discoidin domain-containing protein [Janthinobacterium lividum]
MNAHKTNILCHAKAMPISALAFLSCLLLSASTIYAQPPLIITGTVTVQITLKPVNTFIAAQALGAGVDGMGEGDMANVYTPVNLKAMKSAGLGALTYRLRTELGVECWHWNPVGTWSERGKSQGYWTSSAASKSPINVCYGYRLPRRGDTVDQANNDGYSRLDDGNAKTFWKSNPYLDRRFTGEDNAKHPQWVLINLGRVQAVNAVQIAWGSPFARKYQVQFWLGRNSQDPQNIEDTFRGGTWQTFSQGTVVRGQGGSVRLRLASIPIPVRYVRVWMTASGPPVTKPGEDVRDTLGYAIREIGLGTLDRQGHFHDLIRHTSNGKTQTQITVSSTDPWHRASDLDTQVEQPGFDRVFRSGLTRGLPLLVPTGLLYDTPENAASEVRFLKQRGYPVNRVELGEEPDGPYIAPEDYGALYARWAKKLHQENPKLALGGPSLQTTLYGCRTWPDAQGNRSWMNRFLGYLTRCGHLSDYTFFSFEWYPFDSVCAPHGPQLARSPALLEDSLARLSADGLPPSIPKLITEYGYSAFAGEAEMDWPGALFDAETPALFLTLGGVSTYFYGYEPNEPMQEVAACQTYGNLALLLADGDHILRQPLASYYAMKLLTQDWAQPNTIKSQSVYRAVFRSSVPISVTAYALHRPDGQWALLLLNKDPRRTCRVSVRFAGSMPQASAQFSVPPALVQYSAEDYRWHPAGSHGFALPDKPPRRRTLSGNMLDLPPYSLSLLRGEIFPKNAPRP